MKNRIYHFVRYAFMGLFIGLVSCADWLDVTPEAEVNHKKMFATPEGFQAVLNGIYIEASKDELYGGELSYRFADVLSQYYDVSLTSHIYYGLQTFDYKDKMIKPITEKIWHELYFCIANCNILLENLEKVSPDFFPVDYHYPMIKGEALALRAFFHLDLLRLYAPAPAVEKDALAIPYVSKYTSQITPHMTTQIVLERIIGDLEKARELLREGDPICFDKEVFMNTSVNYKFTQPYQDDYFGSYRIYRLNYFAVTGLLARAYAWRNEGDDLKTAVGYAQEVMDSQLFPFIEESDLAGEENSRDAIFQSELLFCFSGDKMVTNFERYTSSGTNQMKLIIQSKNEIFFQETEDFRLRKIIVKNKEARDVSLKYKTNHKVPGIRLSELYYVKAQYAGLSSVEEGREVLELLRRKRGLNAGLSSRVTTYEELLKAIVKDAQKEFLAEGQAFYMYKRLNIPVLKGNTEMTMAPENYVIPLPDVELEFGDRLTNLLNN